MKIDGDNIYGLMSLGDMLEGILPGRRWKLFLPRKVIWQKWEDIVGPAIFEVSCPWYFRDKDTLVIAVADSMWMQQLSFERSMLLQKINAMLDESVRLKELVFKIAEVDEIKRNIMQYRPKDLRHEATEDISAPLNVQEIAALNSIEDEELKQSFINLLKRMKEQSR